MIKQLRIYCTPSPLRLIKSKIDNFSFLNAEMESKGMEHYKYEHKSSMFIQLENICDFIIAHGLIIHWIILRKLSKCLIYCTKGTSFKNNISDNSIYVSFTILSVSFTWEIVILVSVSFRLLDFAWPDWLMIYKKKCQGNG